MKQKILYCLLSVLIFFYPLTIYAQFDDLKAQLKGKKTFDKITATVEQYLQTAPDSYEKAAFEKHFNRWAYYQSLHLGPNGKFVNVAKRTFKAVAEKKLITDAKGTSNGLWVFTGPSSTTTDNPSAYSNGLGRVDRIAFHPSNPNIIYVGTPAGGLWKTIDGGVNWTPISNFIPSLGISGIVVDHSDPDNTIYVLTGDGDSYIRNSLVFLSGYHQLSVGVLITHDGGITWEQTGQLSPLDEWVGYRLVQHPTNANILIAATDDGIYRTTNGGDTWIQERTGKYFDIEFKPGTPSHVYATGMGGFVYSTDTGDNWNDDATFVPPLCIYYRDEICVTDDDPDKVYLLAAPKRDSSNSFCGFYLSTNGGLDFQAQTFVPNVFGDENGDGDQSEYDMGVAVSPTDDQIIIAAGLIIYKSTDGGIHFNNATFYYESGGEYIHPDIHTVEYNPLNGYLYAGGDGGFHLSTDNGDNWTDLYNGINTTQFYHIDDYDADKYVILGGAQDNGLKYRSTNTADFSHISGGDGFDEAINYNDQTKGYAVVNNFLFKFSSFTNSSPVGINDTGFFKQVELNSSDPNIVYYGNQYVYKYTADLNTSEVLGNYQIHGFWALKTCPSNSARIYAAGGTDAFALRGKMYMSADNGDSWDTISNGDYFPAKYPRISDIGVEPDNSFHVYVCFSGYTDTLKVYYSNNAGNTWENISYDLPNIPVWSIAVDASNNIYIGTDYGVFYKECCAENWEPFYNRLPNVPVSDLAINEGSDQLLASTFGRGIWRSKLRNPCPEDLTINGDLQGQYFKSASNSITLTGNIIGGAGTQVWLRSGNYVDLKPGSKANAEPGNKFMSYIGDCGSGMPPEFSFGNPADTGYIEKDFIYSLARNLGTLQIVDVSANEKKVIVRLFNKQKSQIKIFMTEENGRFIKNIAQFEASKGLYEYTFRTDKLHPGMYYLYLGVNRNINHLQEFYITGEGG